MRTESRGRDGSLDEASINLHYALIHCWAALVPLLREGLPDQMLDAAAGFVARFMGPQYWALAKARSD